MTPKHNWHNVLLRAWSLRFLALSMFAFGLEVAFPYIAEWLPVSQQFISAIGFFTGALAAYARLCPQRNLPGEP